MVVHLPDDDKEYNALGLDRIKRIAEKAERRGFCYDCCHHYHYYPNYDLLTKFGSRLMTLHLHDYDGNTIHRLPFDGTIDWPAAMKKISETGYSGATAIEAMNWSYRQRNFLQEAFERAKRLEALRCAK
jgi:Sugar phosphate isomerases/epimerases